MLKKNFYVKSVGLSPTTTSITTFIFFWMFWFIIIQKTHGLWYDSSIPIHFILVHIFFLSLNSIQLNLVFQRKFPLNLGSVSSSFIFISFNEFNAVSFFSFLFRMKIQSKWNEFCKDFFSSSSSSRKKNRNWIIFWSYQSEKNHW